MKIRNKKTFSYKGTVYDLQVKNDPSYNVHNIVVHNSAGGSLISYLIGITELDPIKYDLMFERFQNPERISLPDIDLDFAQGSREHIRHYLEEKYGKESVLGVVTYGTYKAKSAIQDVSRSLGKDTSFQSVLMSEISKLEGIEECEDLPTYFAELQNKSSITASVKGWIKDNQDTIKWAQKLIGQIKNLGTHAGGILITEGPVYDYIPVTRGSKEVVTAFGEADGSGKNLSDLGLLKLDVLGLITLNIIQQTIDDVKAQLGVDISEDIKFINEDDPNLLRMFAQANTNNIFQMDKGAKDLIKMIKPDCFGDVVAINALNRPGPKEIFGPLYGKWKKLIREGKTNECKKDEFFPKLDFMLPILEPTYYCCIFQEQVMQLVQHAGGFNLGEADNFRRYLGWRKDNPKYYLFQEFLDKLTEKMLGNGYSLVDVEYFVSYMKQMSSYSFNKSHSVAYALTAMQTLYLKYYYPAYFFSAVLNYEKEREMYGDIIGDIVANEIELLPPSITKSKEAFTVEDGKIRIGLKAISGFGDAAFIELQKHNVSSLTLFELLSIKFSKFNKGIFKKALDVGAFDEFGVEREKIVVMYDLLKDPKIDKWFTRKKGALTLATMPISLNQFAEWLINSLVEEIKTEPIEKQCHLFVEKLIPHIKAKTISEEKKNQLMEELLGFSLGHADKIKQLLKVAQQYPELKLKSLSTRNNNEDLCYWYLVSKRKATTKNGKPYWVLKITDGGQTVNAKCWELLEFSTGSAYVSNLKMDSFGYSIIINQLLSEIEI